MPGAASLQIALDNPLQKLLPLKLPAVLELNLFLAESCTSWHLENKDSPMGLLWKDWLGTASVTPGRMEPLQEGRGKGFELRFSEGSSRRDLLLPTSHLQSVPSPARKGLSQDLPPVVTLAKLFPNISPKPLDYLPTTFQLQAATHMSKNPQTDV